MVAQMAPEIALIRCVDCRCEYQPGRRGSIVCPHCGGAAWISAEITLAPDGTSATGREPAAE